MCPTVFSRTRAVDIGAKLEDPAMAINVPLQHTVRWPVVNLEGSIKRAAIPISGHLDYDAHCSGGAAVLHVLIRTKLAFAPQVFEIYLLAYDG